MAFKYDPYHNFTIFVLNLERLSSVSANMEPAVSKTNEIFEINVLQKFTPHALYAVFH